MKVSLAACAISTILIVTLKATHAQRYFVLNMGWHISQLVLACIMLAGLDYVFLRWLYRLSVSIRLKMKWSLRRKRPVIMFGTLAFSMNLILISEICTNALILAHPHFFCKMPLALTFFTGIRWLGWNTIMFLMLIDAHKCCMILDMERTDGLLGTDMQWSFYGPKAAFWALVSGVSTGVRWRQRLC